MQQPAVPVSFAIRTLNEEANLPCALRSERSRAAESVVCDIHSGTATVAIARSFRAQVCLHVQLGFADPARAFGLAHAGHDWVLGPEPKSSSHQP